MKNRNFTKTNSARTSKSVGLFFGVFLVFVLAYLVQKDISLPSWLIAGCAMLGFLFLFIKSFQSPMPALITVVCYIPFSKILVGDFGGGIQALNFTNILMIFVFIGIMIRSTSGRKGMSSRNNLNIPILFFCLITMLSFIRGSLYFGYYGDFIELLSQVKRWLTPPLIFYLAFNAFSTKKDLKDVIKIIMIVVALVGVMATWDYINVGHVSNLDKARIGGIADQPNQLAGFFVYYMFLYAGFFLTIFPRGRAWFFLIPMLFAFRGIMVTFSRGGYVAFAIGGLATSFFKNKIFFVMVLSCLIFLILNPQFLPGGIRYRMGQTLLQGNDLYESTDLENSLEMSSRRRVEIWKAGWEMIKDSPWLGFGYGTFPSIITKYNPLVAGRDAHNSYIIIAAEMGIPALLSFLLIIAILFKETLWVYKRTNDKFFKSTALGMLGGIFGLLVVNVFGSRLNTLEISGYFWILAAIILRIKSIEIEEQKGDKNVRKSKKRLSKSL